MKPICVPCERFMRPEKNGFYFTEGMPSVNDAPTGVAGLGKWAPYKVWVGDKWKCPDCGAEIIIGVGRGPIVEHYQPEFAAVQAGLGADQLQINDC